MTFSRKLIGLAWLSVATGLGIAGCSSPSQFEAGPPTAQQEQSPPESPTIRILEPADGSTVTSPFMVRVETNNIDLARSGRTVDGEGHWHVMTNGECLEPSEVIPQDPDHHHVGSGEAMTSLELPAGEHDLCVQMGDGFHVAVSITDTVKVVVEEG